MEIGTNRTIMGLVIPPVGIYIQKEWIKRHLHPHVHCSMGHNSQDGKSTQMCEED